MAERYWQTKTRNIVIPIPNAVNIEPRCMVEKELAESDAWLLSMVLPLTAELLGLGNRFEEPYIEDKEGKKVGGFRFKGNELEALGVAHMIDRFARYAAYLLSQEGSQEFDPAKDYERHIALPEENERLLVTPVIEDALRRNRGMLVGENQ